MWTRDAVLRGANKNQILHGLIQTMHHLKMVGLATTKDGETLALILKRVQDTLEFDFTVGNRSDLALSLANLTQKIGGMIETQQPGFDSGLVQNRRGNASG